MDTAQIIQKKYAVMASHLDEHSRRLWAATEAEALGFGGISLVARATGISRRAIHEAKKEIAGGIVLPAGRIRKPGGGRKAAIVHHPDLFDRLEALIDPLTRGDPQSPLRWTIKSTRQLADELKKQGFVVSHTHVATMLHKLNYSLQGNCKTLEGNQHPDRNAQFEHINERVTAALDDNQPVISVDTKKKELIGNYANSGKQWLPKGEAVKVQGHDFPDPSVPRAYPYGVYDVGCNCGFVNVGTDHDTAVFAVESIRQWWQLAGCQAYNNISELLITADGGGSNGSRIWLWKWELQQLSDELGIPISVCHFPPGTSKWNKVEHRLFSFISGNWRGEPLVNYETVVNLIANTKTASGLLVKCRLDRSQYPTGESVSKENRKSINIKRNDFHGEWNYTISPRQ